MDELVRKRAGTCFFVLLLKMAEKLSDFPVIARLYLSTIELEFFCC